jgi:pimeloyl-ACP methyl ester carboxylesterase
MHMNSRLRPLALLGLASAGFLGSLQRISADPSATPRRPQEEAIAAGPRPYREETVAFDNPAAPGVRLVGTLTLPNGGGPFPAAIFLGGSGRHDRDETIADHKPGLVLADALARQGCAVLRYDKRGAGQSTGDYAPAIFTDFISDAKAALAYLRSRPEIAGAKVGIVGHSEGATIGAILAADDPSVAFVVMLAGFANAGNVLVAEQIRRFDLAEGKPAAEADRTYNLNRACFDAIAAAKDQADAESQVRRILAAADPAPAKALADQALKFARMPSMRFILAYDPAPSLRRLRAPVLALDGSKDTVVPPDINLPALRAALAQDADATVVVLPGLNHFFQLAGTGAPSEMPRIEQTLAPEALAIIVPWVGAHASAPALQAHRP